MIGFPEAAHFNPECSSLFCEEMPEEIEADEARWDSPLAASPEKMLRLALGAKADILAGRTTEIDIVDGELVEKFGGLKKH